ncbi:hypothetical protein [Nitrospirillum sp. BR 11163]|uniref:hypothetical protein n=1 Tax=Nitrospirillum sp. BR 11163 TaxID=3104323 RepID=UPI002AFE571B|nr:hypothetical protein [Nitrospirillum sp. BR 11163]MEA1674114.1 hypothetical protein [Nitrospirillum sp. BR 11163]
MLVSTLAVAVSALAHRKAGRRRPPDDDEAEGTPSAKVAVLASGLAVLVARMDRAERDIANDKQGRQAVADALAEIKVIAARLTDLTKDMDAIAAKQDRQSANLDRVHTRIDELHHAVVANPIGRRSA